jgi:hypothetical protein
VRSLAFILVLAALGALGAYAASFASGASAASTTNSLVTAMPETTTWETTQTAQTTIVQDTTVTNSVIVKTVITGPGLLLTPRDGAVIRLKTKRLLRFTWLKPDQATYYSLQLYRGTKMILSVSPIRPSYTLAKRWTYRSTDYALRAGTYNWYVWPGFGLRSAAQDGALLGSSTLRVVP